ncbi:MAG: adaptin domain-containing protein, partial [Ilumatobacteraceae bacterium]|nr:adaptin domain-containing protein [Ilumatobacteraceae bacterium]
MSAPSRREVIVAGHTGDRHTARDGLQSADPDTRASALGALDRLGDLTADEVAAALGDPSPVVRRRAA